MQQNRKIIHYDTTFSTKVNNNPFQCNFILKEKLLNISRIYLKSIELPLASYNIRLPYSYIRMQITVNGISNNIVLQMNSKTYIDINLFLIDLNILLLNNIVLLTGEVVPQFYISTTEINKLIIKTTLITSSIQFYNEGLLYYYLGTINPLIPSSKLLISGLTYLYTYNLIYSYNLCFDNYYSFVINNLNLQSNNNNNMQCTFKIIINSMTNTVNFTAESNNFVQDVILPSYTNLSELNITIYDKYNNIVSNNNFDFSFSLGFEF